MIENQIYHSNINNPTKDLILNLKQYFKYYLNKTQNN